MNYIRGSRGAIGASSEMRCLSVQGTEVRAGAALAGAMLESLAAEGCKVGGQFVSQCLFAVSAVQYMRTASCRSARWRHPLCSR